MDIKLESPKQVLEPLRAHFGRRKTLEVLERVSHIVKPTT